MRNTIRNVMIVVLVLMTSCQVSLKRKYGPNAAHATMTEHARRNVTGRPDACAVHFVNRVNHVVDLVGLMIRGCYHSLCRAADRSRKESTRVHVERSNGQRAQAV